jgi:hypothetical protein
MNISAIPEWQSELSEGYPLVFCREASRIRESSESSVCELLSR